MVFERHDIKLETKLPILHTCVLPLRNFDSEAWNVAGMMEKKTDACENNWL